MGGVAEPHASNEPSAIPSPQRRAVAFPPKALRGESQTAIRPGGGSPENVMRDGGS